MKESRFSPARMNMDSLTKQLRTTGYLDENEVVYDWYIDDEHKLIVYIGSQNEM